MTKRIVILGGGTAGTLTANRLRRRYDESACRITVVDRDDEHLYQPGLLFLPFAPHARATQRPARSRKAQLHSGVGFREAEVDHVDTAGRKVHLVGEAPLDYDVLIIATGARLQPEETDGLLGPAWGQSVFTFYDHPGAQALGDALRRFRGGRLVVDVADLPIKCPVAPLEFCFLADAYLRRRGLRERTELSYATPLDAAFTRPVAARTLGGLLERKGIRLVTDFALESVDGPGGRLTGYDGREVPFDLAVVVPLHGGAEYVGRSPGLGDALNFVPVDPHTLQSLAAPEIFAIGDATALPASKAGSVAHFEGEVLAHNVERFLAGRPLDASFDGHANCFVATGFGKALLIDFNEDTEPLPGHYPGRFGLPLLRESRFNHYAKRAFPWLYWHSLLPGRDLPGIGSAMPEHGKLRPLP